MPRTVLKKTGYSVKPTQKALKRKKTRQQVFKASSKISLTKHGEERLHERFTKKEEKIKINIVNSIIAGRCMRNDKYRTYKIYGDFGIYILSADYKVITLISENNGSPLDKYYFKVPFPNRKQMLKDLGVDVDKFYPQTINTGPKKI